jgi:hypothetical protein
VTEPEAQKLIIALVTAFPNEWRFLDADQQESTRKLYRHMMRDLDVTACAAACARLVATRKKMPTIAEIRDATAAQMNGRRVLGGEAWGSVTKAIAREGRRKKPGEDFRFRNPVTARVVDAMGWEYLCNMTDDRSTADRARFIELYEQLAVQAAEDLSVAEIAPPIPRNTLAAGPTHIRDIVDRLLPAPKE